MPIDVKLDLMMVKNRISSTELSTKLGITMSNLSILKITRQEQLEYLPSISCAKY